MARPLWEVYPYDGNTGQKYLGWRALIYADAPVLSNARHAHSARLFASVDRAGAMAAG
jgi:hypothetical protein